MKRVTASLGVVAALFVSERAAAEWIAFRFTGTVVSTIDSAVLPVGQSMTGSYTFESNAVDIYGAEQGIFRDAENTDWSTVLNLRLESGDYVLETPADRFDIVNAGGTLLINRNAGQPHHTYGIYFQRDLDGGPWSPPLAGERVFRVGLELIDANQQAIADPSILPLTPPDLADFTTRRLRLHTSAGDFVEFAIDSLTLAPGRTLPGAKLALSDPAAKPGRRKLLLAAKSPLTETPAPGPNDPTQLGATMRVASANGGDDDAQLELPAAGWRGLGTPAGTKGWAYADRTGELGPCTSLVAKPGKGLTATCKGAAIQYSLDEPGQDAIAVLLTLGGEAPQCMRFGGDVRKDVPGTFRARKAPRPWVCPLP